MSVPDAISVEGLSKRYLVGHSAPRADSNATLRDGIARGVRDLARKTRDMLAGRQIVQGDTVEEFWALRDVSFNIPKGARVGILGRNGAGKSTLLKCLSRITEPTAGLIRVSGRAASLLEVGTGFHPELSGRENIFLNGAIMGMSRREVQSKFEEIVEFAEVDRFLDTPVKRYSSGMYVRLAFAVAAHLDPEILIVDEVLAVGDVQFQKKCLGKMNDVAQSGRTILFVSHNMAAISQLCDSAIILKGGQVDYQGPVKDAVARYLNGGGETRNPADLRRRDGRKGTGLARFEQVSLADADGLLSTRFSMGDDLVIQMKIRASAPLSSVSVAFELRASDGFQVCNVIDSDSGFNFKIDETLSELSVTVRNLRLYPDRYYLLVWIGTPDGRETYDYVEADLHFDVTDGGRFTSRPLPRSSGLIFLTPEWRQVPMHAMSVAATEPAQAE
jgi:lipopolysaccharide transport system ATP-binding protein